MGRLTKYKLKGSSLVETITATIILMIVFTITMMSIGNILERTVKSNISEIDARLNQLEYLYRNDKLVVPDLIQGNDWNIRIRQEKEADLTYIVFRARSKNSTKQKTKRILEN